MTRSATYQQESIEAVLSVVHMVEQHAAAGRYVEAARRERHMMVVVLNQIRKGQMSGEQAADLARVALLTEGMVFPRNIDASSTVEAPPEV